MSASAEKLLKAFLFFSDQEISKTHNLDLLLKNCALIDPEFLNVDFKDLEYFAVRARYPHHYAAPELEEAKEYYQVSTSVKELVLRKIT
ncbi:hypothetical protein GCM10023143_16270 [Compostibacter hankyongensis]|uniref:HEPN domain-containing protein n=1 Tax=Compostibacter hankyongensis TaxID=1007089 RepID=A0ABP8FQD9_9BACT